jgi:hypothetical protein
VGAWPRMVTMPSPSSGKSRLFEKRPMAMRMRCLAGFFRQGFLPVTGHVLPQMLQWLLTPSLKQPVCKSGCHAQVINIFQMRLSVVNTSIDHRRISFDDD